MYRCRKELPDRQMGRRQGLRPGRRLDQLHALRQAFVCPWLDGLFNSIRLDDSYVYYGAGWSVLSDKIGVDSAACGFFDEANYKGGEDELDDWRDMCCSAKTSGGDVIPYGVVVQSGYGDGVYLCLQHTNKEGQVDAMAVIFG